jgi:acyl carrier protein
MDVKGLARRYIGETVAQEAETLADNSSLMGQGIIDSAGILELVAFVEDAFGVRVGDSELVPENFDSLNAIQSYLERKRALAPG